jgi:peptidoglycan/LPS O-acetylase OafA/YrhL
MPAGTRDAALGEARDAVGSGAPGLRYMPALDGLRAFAVLAVLLYHGDVSWLPGGYLGVDAFFVLSGFLITSLLLAEWRNHERIDLRSFWSRRARRLLPALVVVLAAVVAYAAFVAQPVELRALRRDTFAALSYLANWNQVFSDVSYFEQYGAPSPLRHMWSLAIEEQFYLIWPLVVFALLRWSKGSRRVLGVFCGILAVASALWMAWLHQPGADPSRVYYGTDTRAQSLLFGALLATLLAGGHVVRTRGARTALHGAGIAAAAALAWIWTTTSDGDAWQYRGGYALAAVLVAVVIASVAGPSASGPFGRVLSIRPLVAIGMVSYGLYLWHWPVYVYLSPDRTGLDGASLLAVRLFVTTGLACASYFVVEQPVRHGALRGWTVRVVAPATAAALVALLVVATSASVPPAFEEVAASELAPPPETQAPSAARAGVVSEAGTGDVAAAAPVEPLRVMLVGDSVARSLGPGIARAAAARGFVFWDASVPGCGLASDVGERWLARWQGLDERCVPPWRSRFPQQLAEFRPHVVVALFGAQDAFDRRVDGQVVPFDSPEGERLARADLEEAADLLTAGDTELVLLTAPYYRICCPMPIEEGRSPMNEAWIDRYNRVQRTVAVGRTSSVTVLDLNRVLDPGGTWTDTVDGVKVRSYDRSHLSEEGADFVAAWLAPQLLEQHAATRSDDAPSDHAKVAGSLIASIPFVGERS